MKSTSSTKKASKSAGTSVPTRASSAPRGFSCLGYLLMIIIVVVAVIFYRIYYQVLAINVSLDSIPETISGSVCRQIPLPGGVDNIGGTEDLEFVGDGSWAIVSNMDPQMTFMLKPVPKATFPLFAFNIEAEAALAPLPLEGFPSHVSFRPHGISYHRESNTLGVINHAWTFGGERIEFFTVIFEDQKPIGLQYIKSVASPAMGYGQLNDLQVVQVDPVVKFYVTNWWGHPMGGDNGPSLSAKARFLGGLIAGINSCTILYCEGDKCRTTGGAALGYNGIYISHDKSKLATVVLGDHGLNLYDILPSGDLSFIGHVHVGYPLDNIYPDLEASTSSKQVFYSGGIRRPIDMLHAIDNINKPNRTRDDIAIPSHARRITIEWGEDNNTNKPSYTVEEVYSTRAKDNIGAWSVFAKVPNSNKYIIGSFLEPSLLVCG
ncbi:hypothetical protein FOL47_001382 [Perkinsus chesapeaki]|uniref:Uncharacterized protein n=1 Tax=Perkinsus chesapeaki TaxID=330153 RepID=A0A7J6MJH5_PERCH|nr:hypothetical protein FOL47_001382 [Perkinsus chesapeaki]